MTVIGTVGIMSLAIVGCSNPYAMVGVFSAIKYPIKAIIDTRPCITSASRKRLAPVSSLSLAKPKGSKNPSGPIAPGRPYRGRLLSGTHPLMGVTFGTSGSAGAVDSLCKRRVWRLLEIGAKAEALPMVASNKATEVFMFCFRFNYSSMACCIL